MAVTFPCPDQQTLEQLQLGRLSLAEVERLAQHLEQCERCVVSLQELKTDDMLVGALRTPSAPIDRPEQEVVKRLTAFLKGLLPPATVSSVGCAIGLERPHASPAAGAEASACQDSAQEALQFLAPAEGPGELGRLGPYRILRLLGAGGMGVVLAAEDPQLQRTVAVKVMQPRLADTASARQRFLREARAMAAVKHDHIVTIYHVGEDRAIPFLAMEFLEGETLETRLQREERLPPTEVVRIGREMAEGLHAAHAQGLTHRDIKPSNVWLEGKKGRVKILDFGLARAAGGEPNLTKPGAIVGTPAYMAPEQASGQAVDARSDLFSVGCVLYRVATGQPPFQGSDTVATLLAVTTQNPRAPREVNPEVSPGLSGLIMRLLAKDPKDRPETAAELATALAAFTGPLESTLSYEPPGLPGKPAGNRRRLLAAGLLAGLLAVAGWAWFGRSTAPAPPAGGKGSDPGPAAPGSLTARLRLTRFAPDGFNVRLVGDLGDKAYRVRYNDRVEVEALLSEPAYAYLIAFNPSDKPEDQEQLLPRREADQPPPRRDRISPDSRLKLDDGEGLQAFAVVASRQPLPAYAEWCRLRSPRRWRRVPATSGVVWTADGEGVRGQYEPGFERATEEALGDKAVLRELARTLKRMPGVEAVVVVGFAVDRAE